MNKTPLISMFLLLILTVHAHAKDLYQCDNFMITDSPSNYTGCKKVGSSSSPQEKQEAQPTSTTNTNSGIQQKREDAINKLIQRGVFTKVEMPGTVPRIYVGDTFYMALIDQKRLFTSIVYAYYNTKDSTITVVGLHDSRTGKEVGTFSEYGLNLY